ncbi:MAG: T9SS type A sorting domain-containing protein [Flavobacteriales bacterium]|jgi:hypothetical protein|nr:T9SS type A sorting domain-containing protein [Flavobacteriales bacterium]
MTLRSIVLFIAMALSTTVNAVPDEVPPNDEPCGAIALQIVNGCMPRRYATTGATTSDTTSPGALSVPAPCDGAIPNNDVWFTALVPANGELRLEMEATTLSDAALAIYTAEGSCTEGTLSLTPAACATDGSTYDEAMPLFTATGLTPNSTVYVRVWRESGEEGDALLCAGSTNPVPGPCTFVANLTDQLGTGWGDSFVRICINPPGPDPAICNDLSIDGSSGTFTFGVSVGTVVSITSYPLDQSPAGRGLSIITMNGVPLYSNAPIPAGPLTAFAVNSICNMPPAPYSSCIGSIGLSTYQLELSIGGWMMNYADDLGPGNQGCLINGEEHAGAWIKIPLCNPGPFAFTITPEVDEMDVNWALWGPVPWNPACPLEQQPIRCSRAATSGVTGLIAGALDQSEDITGDGWLEPVPTGPEENYMLYLEGNNDLINTVTLHITAGYLNLFGLCDITTTITDRYAAREETIHPNPAHTALTLQPGHGSPYQWQLIDARGSLVRSGNHTGDFTLSVNDMPKGLYLIRTRTNEGSAQEHRWMKE